MGAPSSADIAYLVAILQAALADQREGEKVVVKVCEPKVIPPDYRGTRVAGTDTLGASVSFPSSWLILPPPSQHRSDQVVTQGPSDTPAIGLVEGLHQVLLPHLQEADLDTEQVADLLGMSRRTLARQLHNVGTTLGTELARLRRQRAERLLLESELSISQVGAAVGYPDGAAFARAFRRWTGSSPKQYRASGLRALCLR